MALCSLSTGMMGTPRSRAAAITREPAATRVSLLARATGSPASMAARVGSSPTAPTMAETTRSAPEATATSRTPALPQRISGASAGGTSSRKLAATASLCTDTRAGRNCRICSARTLTFCPAANPATANSPGCSATTARVLWPMEPVEPRIARRFMELIIVLIISVLPHRNLSRSPTAGKFSSI